MLGGENEFNKNKRSQSKIVEVAMGRPDQGRGATPFHFEPVELINHDDGRVIATYERFAHSVTLSAGMKGFDGATEWRVWDNRVVELVKMLQSR